jgi:carbon storage regulator
MRAGRRGLHGLETARRVVVLTLTRKIGESICIGDDIKIVVKEIKGKQVRLGIIAPQDVYVCRDELYEKIQQANVQAQVGPDVNILDSISGLFGAGAKAPRDGRKGDG